MSALQKTAFVISNDQRFKDVILKCPKEMFGIPGTSRVLAN